MLYAVYQFRACLSSHITPNATCWYRYSQKAMDGNIYPPVPLPPPFVSDPPHNGNPGAILPHDGNPDAPGPLLVVGCTIKGIEGVTVPMREHVIVFYTKLLGMMSHAGESWQLIRKEKHARITDALLRIRNGKRVADVKKIYPQTYK
jgi:hypothetical protein